ncbi:MAG: hypothetical protein RBS32_02895 [Aliarcobacter sp.]|jgi:hypothetical protein|nr:hypothetical protein [Aliarcobacter sp.]
MKQQNIKDAFLANFDNFIKKNKLKYTIEKIEYFVSDNHNLNNHIIKEIFTNFQNQLLNSDKKERNSNFIFLFTPKQDSDIAKKARYFLINNEEYSINRMQIVLLIITFQYYTEILSNDTKFKYKEDNLKLLNTFIIKILDEHLDI